MEVRVWNRVRSRAKGGGGVRGGGGERTRVVNREGCGLCGSLNMRQGIKNSVLHRGQSRVRTIKHSIK